MSTKMLHYSQHKIVRLVNAPDEIGTQTRKAYNILWETFGGLGFHPLEGRGVLRALLDNSLTSADVLMQNLYERGFLEG